MTVLHWLFGDYVGLALVYLVVVFATPNRLVARGRIFSRWLARLLRVRSTFGWRLLFRIGQLIVFDVALRLFLNGHDGPAIGWVYATLLFLDDLVTGDDQDPRWRRATGKVKLKMPEPVPIRPIERRTGCSDLSLLSSG